MLKGSLIMLLNYFLPDFYKYKRYLFSLLFFINHLFLQSINPVHHNERKNNAIFSLSFSCFILLNINFY